MTGHRWFEAARVALRDFQVMAQKSVDQDREPSSCEDERAMAMRQVNFIPGCRVLVTMSDIDWTGGEPGREVTWKTPGYVIENDQADTSRAYVVIHGSTIVVDKARLTPWDGGSC